MLNQGLGPPMRGERVRGERASLNDVATEAKVSVSTVSRYLNGQLSLRPDTELRVIEAMEAVGYTQPSKPQRVVVRPRADSVLGLVVPLIGNTYFGHIADAIVKAAEAHGLPVLITSTLNHSRKQLDYVDLLVEKGVSGLIYAGNFASNKALAAVVGAGVPVVVIDEQISGLPPVDTVLVDDYAGAYQAVSYLVTLGHTRISLVTGPSTLRSVKERTRGYRDALVRAGLDPSAQTLLSGAFSEEAGTAALSHLLASPEPPTAVFAASDTIALGLLSAARTFGVSVPGELSVVGFDDMPNASLVTPRLTTIHTPVDKMAAAAVALLIERIDDSTREAQTVVTPVSLIIGGSTSTLTV
jgi:DNA-binding LacI/PurR family transcriptional regulator